MRTNWPWNWRLYLKQSRWCWSEHWWSISVTLRADQPSESVSEVAQSCPTLCDPMDCSLPGSPVHGILQAIVMEWIAISFSRGSSQPRDRTQVSHIVDRCFTVWATRECNLDSILKSRGITLSTKIHLVKAMVFPGVMYGCESWTIKKAECRKMDAFEL